MNFKIEINYLNVDNYPRFEKHFEEMAKNGWLINRFSMNSIFIYKKIKPQELDFSISPYETETALNRKSKADLNEFHEVSKNVGWELATKSTDLHIYFKTRGSSAVPIHTDEEEEFNTIKKIAKRYFNSQYIILPFLILFSFINASGLFNGGLFNSIRTMKDGYVQFVILLLPITIILNIFHFYNLKKFLKKNEKNVENGEPLEFNNSQHGLYKFMYTVVVFIYTLLILYALYTIFIFKNVAFIIALIPVIMGMSLGFLFRKIIKPINKSKGFKLSAFLVVLVLAFTLGESLDTSPIKKLFNNDDIIDTNKYKILTSNGTVNENAETFDGLSKDASLLIPESYNYISLSEQGGFLITEYSKALTESLAVNLVHRYIQRGEKNSIGIFRGQPSFNIEMAIERGSYNSFLEDIGFTEQDYNKVMNKDMEEAIDQAEEIFLNKSIVEDNSLWNLDEVYFLTYEKDEIVLRDSNEVFYLRGADFSDPTIISLAKKQLNLN